MSSSKKTKAATANKTTITAVEIEMVLKDLGSADKAASSARFFKTGKGQYGAGDVFFGVPVPEQRKIAKEFMHTSRPELKKLLQHKVHECRLTALLILTLQYKKASQEQRQAIVEFYLSNTKFINNWDLVDSSAPYILGHFLLDQPKNILYELAASSSLWERRISIIATQAFIRKNKFEDTLRIAKLLLKDKEDLIHKACGWMLREIGERSVSTERNFLLKHAATMPRTMLRYAIEKFPEDERLNFLKMGKTPARRPA